MTVSLIPRPEALLKLIALGPIAHDEARIVCGWPAAEFRAIVRDLNRQGLIGWAHRDGTRTYRLGLCLRTRQRRAKAAA